MTAAQTNAADTAAYYATLKASGGSASTLMLRRSQLGRLMEAFPRRTLRSLTTSDLIEYFSTNGSQWGSSTAYSYRCTLKNFYSVLLREGLVTSNPAAAMPRVKVKNKIMTAAPESSVLDRDDLDDRARLMLELGARQGLRRIEIARLHSRDLVRDGAGWSLIVHGKGDKDRLIPLHDDIAERLRAREAGWVFPSDRSRSGHISPDRVGFILNAALPDGWSGHSLRRRFATKIYAETHDVRAVQQLLGHTSLDVTQRYIGTQADSLRTALGHS